MKHNNIHIMGIPEGEEREQGIENLFEEIMTGNFPTLVKIKDIQIQGRSQTGKMKKQAPKERKREFSRKRTK